MIPHSLRIYLLLIPALIQYPVNGQSGNHCIFSTLPKEQGEICTAEIDCQNYVSFDVSTWSCIRHVTPRSDYDYGYYRKHDVVTYDDNYNLIINVQDPDEIDVFNVNVEHFTKLTLKNGALISMPQEVYQMTQLKEIDISGTKIITVNLNKFISLSRLNKIKVASNLISVIDLDEENIPLYSSMMSKVETIDLSCNLIEVVPNNFVSRFNQLQHLNLSHNMIKSLDLLTFEGIVQLKTLDISYNRLFEIGNALARFINLLELSVANNNLTKLVDYNFGSLTSLEKLNVSSNYIDIIENNVFQSLTKLEFLDLSYNKIQLLNKQLLSKNVNLNSLFLIENEIKYIESNCFANMNITEFHIRKNCLEGAVMKETFKGINVNTLDLSGGNISTIEDGAFTDMFDLSNLNLSSNVITNISQLAFSTLGSLEVLDLSHNKLTEISFGSYGLQNITKLYAQHNRIQRIEKNVFEKFLSLRELDLSNNDIKEIEWHSFLNLTNVESLNFNKCHFVITLESEALKGLSSLKKLDLSETRTQRFKNESFTGLTALTYINSAFGQLADIEYNAFLGTGSLEVLDFSHNQIQDIHINSSTISNVQEIFLHNNIIKNISSETFSKLVFLRKLNLAYNAIKQLSTNTFKYTNELMFLDLSLNTDMQIIGKTFQNLSKLYSLSLANVKTDIRFTNCSVSVEVLDMQSCDISNLSNVHVFNVKNVNFLNLSMNEISSIDKDSFRNMSSLVSLDLSKNKIVSIQPGSFLHLKNLIRLNLFENYLPSIMFGAFDGTEMLRELNLSSNVLISFDIKLLQSYVIEKLSLDNNIITNLNFEDFFHTNISELSIGGNQISCKVLADLKKSRYAEKFMEIVTAKTLSYHSENVNGISCQNIPKDTLSDRNVTETSVNYISPLVSSMKNAISKLDKTLQALTENTNKTNELEGEAKTVIKSFDEFIESSNKSQIMSNHYLFKLINFNNDSNIQLSEIKEYLKNLTVINKDFNQRIEPIEKPSTEDKNIVIFKTMLKQENDALREEFKNALSNLNKETKTPFHASLITPAGDSNDNKYILYFIAICSAVMLAAYLGNLVFSHVTKYRQSNATRNSATPISNSIEME